MPREADETKTRGVIFRPEKVEMKLKSIRWERGILKD